MHVGSVIATASYGLDDLGLYLSDHAMLPHVTPKSPPVHAVKSRTACTERSARGSMWMSPPPM
eukprot:5363601-Amphidinium_carterae.1